MLESFPPAEPRGQNINRFTPTARLDPTYTSEALARRVLNLQEDQDAVLDYLYTVMGDPDTPQNVIALASAWNQQLDEPEGLYSGPSYVFSHARQIVESRRR